MARLRSNPLWCVLSSMSSWDSSGSADDADDFVLESLRGGAVFAGRYRVVRLLERTRSHALLLVKHVVTQNTLLLKALWPHLAGNAKAMERYELEARLPARLQSEHVFAVLDAGVDGTTQIPYLVIEHPAGQTLHEAVAQQGAFDPVVAVEVLKQVTLALGRAHGQGGAADEEGRVVHGALNPDNVFVCARESGGTLVKIRNFGGVTVSADESPPWPSFMAPEQIRREALSPATDIWALGLLTLYMLSGSLYWEAAGSSEASLTILFKEILGGPLPAPSERLKGGAVSSWTGALDDWFTSCVNRDASQRFPSVYQALSTLESCLALGFRGIPTLSADTTLRSAQPPSASAPLTVAEPSMKFSPQAPTRIGADRTLRSAEAPSPDTPISQVERNGKPVPEPASDGELEEVGGAKPADGLFGWMGRVWRGGRARGG